MATAVIQQRQRSQNRSETLLSGTFGNRGPTVFTTYVLLTLTPPHNRRRGGTGEEEDVSRGLPTSALALLPLCRLSGRAAGDGGDGYPEKNSQLPGHPVEAFLLKDM